MGNSLIKFNKLIKSPKMDSKNITLHPHILYKQRSHKISLPYQLNAIFGDSQYMSSDILFKRRKNMFRYETINDNISYSSLETDDPITDNIKKYKSKKRQSIKKFLQNNQEDKKISKRITRAKMEELWRSGSKTYLKCSGCNRFVRFTSKRYHIQICPAVKNSTLEFVTPTGAVQERYVFKSRKRQ